MPIRSDIVGKGLKYPFEINSGNVQMQPSSTPQDFEEAVNQRISHIFGVLPGERVPRRNWGSYIKTLVFKPIGTSEFESKLEFFARESIEENEPYIYVTLVEIDSSLQDKGIVEAKISYADTETNTPGSLPYPLNTRKPLKELGFEV